MQLSMLAGHRFADYEWSFEPELLLALRTAIGIAPSAEEVPPTLAFSAEMDNGVVDQLFALTELEAHQLLHGEQHFRYHQALQPGVIYRGCAQLSEVVTKPRFSLQHKNTRLLAPDGAPVCDMLSVYVALPVPGTPSHGPKFDEQAFDGARAVPAISREQICAFADASGDHNPVHLDPAVARRAGHLDVFAQGMLGMGMLGGLLPSMRLRRFGVRFISPIPLGDQPRLYQAGSTTQKLVLTNDKGDVRINGYAELN